MSELLKYLDTVMDSRQEKKVRHKMGDIIALVFFALLANADERVEIEIFGKEHEAFLRRYLELPYGIPSHDTIQRVFAMVSPEFLQGFQTLWNEMLSSDEVHLSSKKSPRASKAKILHPANRKSARAS
ncbi:MAG: transposase family protein [Firmicutes bacterium]|nr:transposase family protein [Bacillota bacterium]